MSVHYFLSKKLSCTAESFVRGPVVVFKICIFSVFIVLFDAVIWPIFWEYSKYRLVTEIVRRFVLEKKAV